MDDSIGEGNKDSPELHINNLQPRDRANEPKVCWLNRCPILALIRSFHRFFPRSSSFHVSMLLDLTHDSNHQVFFNNTFASLLLIPITSYCFLAPDSYNHS
ncbi:hypothetical protein B9Z55_007314 [Caenorhabditis nigoni]|uniref:Uncharacterized protein n=1 Tax=Caenorhabditis nigoni TaxID=1611254 RepID=A0A2G5V921_9PELO|nr:hypothetical protein B9Z55_007314 [Caenorhabditis nigoni]